MSARKYTISALPLAPPAQLLTHNLTPDPRTPSVPTFRNEVLATGPSIQRRARLLAADAHFSYVTPFPVPFPYSIDPPTTNQSSPQAELLGISETGLRDCVPHLNLTATEREEITDGPESAVAARKDLIDVLGGRAVLMSDTFAPWAVRYSGHQFGSFAGQLGDGRATSILVTPHPESTELSYELQLKGAGRTPFSRSADGLAVTRSSVREYLCSEGAEHFLFGGGQQVAHWDALRTLGIWVAESVLKLPEAAEGKEADTQPAPWGKALVLEVARRNARMVAGWQAYGFMHGVINTDNVSLLGLTIDYGPYSFMDEGRYAYRVGANLVTFCFAIRALHAALAPLIGAESALGHAEEIAAWRTRGMDELKDELELVYQSETAKAYGELMHKRLALRIADSTDEAKLVRPLLDLMASQKLDFHGTFRALTAFRPGILPADGDADSTAKADLDKLVERLLSQAPDGGPKDLARMADVYARRIERETEEWGDEIDALRGRAGLAANPRFVLRQWLLQEDIVRGRRVLAKVLHMACNPFEPWGGEDADADDEAQLSAEDRMLGFQCSCSS
ncbi:hypothetical protein K438DRAFT_1905167 [Mycena galopus ATCC 62051]|nr:hypothetical protein K438DRAFT_1905167 [Mycena galopus ATCC 62051]